MASPRLVLLPADAPPTALPPAHRALSRPAGLVAAGGSLAPDWLRHAYRHGLFPWFGEGEPICWWSPDPRTVFHPGRLRIPRSLRQSARNRGYEVSLDLAFREVVAACAAPRDGQPGTWIVPEMQDAYAQLHAEGDAHSVEVWLAGELVGGLYGVALGGMFWGESMFTRARDASKVALLALAAECQDRGMGLIDCQFHTDHLAMLGAVQMRRPAFLAEVAQRVAEGGLAGAGPWRRERATPRLPAAENG